MREQSTKNFVVMAVLLAAAVVLAISACGKKPDDLALVKSFIDRWQNGVRLNSPDSLQGLFSAKKEWVVKTPDEMLELVFSSGIDSITVAGRSIRLYREEEEVRSAQAVITLLGKKSGSQEIWHGRMTLLLRKDGRRWGIVDYQFE
ncbi:MAG: hypothetical protein L0Y74_05175, partial [candidate division Zixibacteria bacterium]|nr:hypothetical protein [candidate division Zixibacteria bacterium]